MSTPFFSVVSPLYNYSATKKNGVLLGNSRFRIETQCAFGSGSVLELLLDLDL